MDVFELRKSLVEEYSGFRRSSRRVRVDDLTAYDPGPYDQRGTPLHRHSDRRIQLRAELDASCIPRGGLSRDELRHILDPIEAMGEDYPSETFRVLTNDDMRADREYRTQRVLLAAWDASATGV